jgi:hypothetical protein
VFWTQLSLSKQKVLAPKERANTAFCFVFYSNNWR